MLKDSLTVEPVTRVARRRFAPKGYQLTNVSYEDIEAKRGFSAHWLEMLEQVQGQLSEAKPNNSRRGNQ